MKTRRQFLQILFGGTAAAVVAPLAVASTLAESAKPKPIQFKTVLDSGWNKNGGCSGRAKNIICSDVVRPSEVKVLYERQLEELLSFNDDYFTDRQKREALRLEEGEYAEVSIDPGLRLQAPDGKWVKANEWLERGYPYYLPNSKGVR